MTDNQRQKRWRQSKQAAGFCVRCGKLRKADNKYHCQAHAEYMVKQVRMSQRKIEKLRKEFSQYTTP